MIAVDPKLVRLGEYYLLPGRGEGTVGRSERVVAGLDEALGLGSLPTDKPAPLRAHRPRWAHHPGQRAPAQQRRGRGNDTAGASG